MKLVTKVHYFTICRKDSVIWLNANASLDILSNDLKFVGLDTPGASTSQKQNMVHQKEGIFNYQMTSNQVHNNMYPKLKSTNYKT